MLFSFDLKGVVGSLPDLFTITPAPASANHPFEGFCQISAPPFGVFNGACLDPAAQAPALAANAG